MTVWWRYWYSWAVPGVLLALNLVWLGGVRSVVVGHGSLLSREVGKLEENVSKLELQRAELVRDENELGQVQSNLEGLRSKQLRPMRDGLIPFLTEVAQKAEEAGLQPERISYTAQLDKKSGLVHFTAAYGVDGTYDQIRKCVYLLETSPQFIVIEGIALRGDQDAATLGVRVQMTIATYFSDLDQQMLDELNGKEGENGG
ncbi:MAG: type 4a pilus biogenesis protein PilO [Acidobacteriota bacterium]